MNEQGEEVAETIAQAAQRLAQNLADEGSAQWALASTIATRLLDGGCGGDEMPPEVQMDTSGTPPMPPGPGTGGGGEGL